MKDNKLKFLFPFLLISLFNINTYSNPAGKASISGFVKDYNTKETIISATVFLEGTKLGAYTNKSGFFVIKGVDPGKYNLIVSYLGYEKYQKEIEIKKDQEFRFDVLLQTGSVKANEVIVTGQREADKSQISVSRVSVPVKQLKEIRIGGEADVFRALQFLPGVLTSSQISNGLYIRGGSPDQNLVLIDGATVYNPSHLFGFFSTFNSEAMKDVEVIKGGFNAEYGGRMSSVINISQKDGNRNNYQGTFDLGLVSTKASIEGPTFKSKDYGGSFYIGGRRTYFDLVKNFIPENPENPIPDYGFWDINAKITQDFGPNDKVSIAGFFSRDNLKFTNPGIIFNLNLGNTTGSLKWVHLFGDNLFSTFILSTSEYNNGFSANNSGYEALTDNAIIDNSVKFDLEWYPNDWMTNKFGFEYNDYEFKYLQNFTGDTDSTQQGSAGGIVNFDVFDNNYAAYAQTNIQLTDNISLQGGLRASYFELANQQKFDPRLASRFQLTENVALKAAWGIYHQNLKLATQPDFSFFDTWLGTDSTLNIGRAQHFILSLETNIKRQYGLNFDIYYKDLRNITELNRFATEISTGSDVLFEGKGEAFGFETFIQKKSGRLNGWIGYSFGFINAQNDSINGGSWYRPKYDRRHDFKIVANYELTDKWLISSSFIFQSGQSYTGQTSRFQSLIAGQNFGRAKTVPSQLYGLRLPNTHFLNVNASYLFKFLGFDSKLYIDIYNVYSRRDIWFRFYDVSKPETEINDIRLLPILPTISWHVDIK